MAQICRKCGQSVENPLQLDVPEGAVLCDECYAELVWTCDSCGRHFALPDIQGGELEGLTPLQFAHWCQECCDAKIALCEECGAEELVKDMRSTGDRLLCERCAVGLGPSAADDSPPLTRGNWKGAVLDAVKELPEDLQQSIGHSYKSDNAMTVTVAGEPIPSSDHDESESSVSKVEIIYWKSMRERGWPPEHDAISAP
jgi:hypothetical protein